MARGFKVTVDCPLCGNPITCTMDPGEPMVTSGPPDAWYPGSPPGVEDWDLSCNCYDSPLVKQDKYQQAVDEAAMQKAGDDWDDDGDAAYEAARDEGRF